MAETARPNDLESYWMPFTANRQFKAKPRLMASAEGMYYRSTDGRRMSRTASEPELPKKT
jgi:beta-alanine--pyruvate transaminase